MEAETSHRSHPLGAHPHLFLLLGDLFPEDFKAGEVALKKISYSQSAQSWEETYPHLSKGHRDISSGYFRGGSDSVDMVQISSWGQSRVGGRARCPVPPTPTQSCGLWQSLQEREVKPKADFPRNSGKLQDTSGPHTKWGGRTRPGHGHCAAPQTHNSSGALPSCSSQSLDNSPRGRCEE